MDLGPSTTQTVAECLIVVLAIWGLGSATRQIFKFRTASMLLYPAMGIYGVGVLMLVSLGISTISL